MKLQRHSEHQRLIGIIGHKLAHTLSPVMHTTAFKKLNLDFTYGVMDVTPEMLPNLIASMRALNFRGANVTVPYKQDVIPLVDEVSEEAKVIGAVNTIVNNSGRLVGYNTDAHGVYISLAYYADSIKNNHVVIFGAGGAARATVYAVAKFFSPKRIMIVNRTLENAKKMAEEFGPKFKLTKFFFTNDPETTTRELEVAALIINTTSVGMKPLVNFHPLPTNAKVQKNQIVLDIVYNPIDTALLQLAAGAGAKVVSGVEMLLGQGAKAFELFTHHEFPMHAAREAVVKELTQDMHQ
ncbi:MAG: shikimate dehydrogenase [Ignavibacteriales bacterium]|nr:shikimate dehydrogenase [Ignavibacteriales bacterium]